LFGLVVVFVILVIIMFTVWMVSFLISRFSGKEGHRRLGPRIRRAGGGAAGADGGSGPALGQGTDQAPGGVGAMAGDGEPGGRSDGELSLVGVDAKTAATVMAIVSHESGIPLSELRFSRIKAL